MFVRGFTVFCLIALVFHWLPAHALKPIQTGTSTAELVLKVSRGEAVLPTSRPEVRAVSSSRTHHRAAPAKKPPFSRPVLPPMPAVTPRANGLKKVPAAAHRMSRVFPVLPEVSLRTGSVVRNERTAAAPRSPSADTNGRAVRVPKVKAKALYCVDVSSNRVVLAENCSEPLPIASITKLLTAMTVIDEMKLDKVVRTPSDIRAVPRHRVGIRPGDLFTVRDLLHGMLIESGNDCAAALARAYPRGGEEGFMAAMNRKARRIGAGTTRAYTPSGLDMLVTVGRKDGRNLVVRKANRASARDVALIARHAFQYPLIRDIATMKTYTMRTRNTKPRNYVLATNDKLLSKTLPVAGAKTGYTSLAGRCIVALFKDRQKEHMVVVLNTPRHFKAAEKIYRWATRTF